MAGESLGEALEAVFGNRLEPDAKAVAKADPRIALSVLAELSSAISLKRIADALDGTAAGVDISESLCRRRER